MDKVKMTSKSSTSKTENCLKANTTITLRCNWDGDFELVDPEGKCWFYPRNEWNDVQNHLWKMIKPATGDPK